MSAMGRLALDAVPPAPREPSPRARELIFRYQGLQRALVWLGAIFAAVGVLFAVPLCWGLPGDLAIVVGGHELQGRVLSRELDRSTKINGRNPTVIRFAYSLDGTRYQAQSSTLDAEVIRAAAPDQLVPIQVAGLNPQWARVFGTTRSLFGYFGLLLLIFPALGVLLLSLAVRSKHRGIRAFVNGLPALAKVVSFGPDYSVSINNRNPFKVRWEFAVGEQFFAGSLSSMSMLALENLGKEKEIVVLYDPADPACNTAWVD